MFKLETGAFISDYLRSSEATGLTLRIALEPASIRAVAEIEGAIAELGRKPGSGLIVPAEAFTMIHPIAPTTDSDASTNRATLRAMIHTPSDESV